MPTPSPARSPLAPTEEWDVAEVAERVRDRAVRWLLRHHDLDERAAEERGNEAAEPSALDACTQLALAPHFIYAGRSLRFMCNLLIQHSFFMENQLAQGISHPSAREV
jgi:hypothetical protein